MAMNSTVKTIRSRSLRTAYLEHGMASNPTIILLHGFPDDPRTWDGVVQRLSGEPMRVLRPWLRGFGGTSVLDETARSGQVGALAQDVLDFADALGVDRFVLVGQDWGSRAAQGVALLAPDRVRGLLLLATAYGRGEVSPKVELTQQQAFWYQWLFQTPHGREYFAADPIHFCEYLWRVWSPEWKFQPEEFDSVTESFANPQFVDTVLHYYAHRWKNAPGSPQYGRQQEVVESGAAVRVPTIFACGTADACNLPAYSRGNERFFGGSYTRMEIPGVGHFVQRERPQVVTELVRKLSGTLRE
jgi:pimeloyl-ACP methyl ester carboxylesterase